MMIAVIGTGEAAVWAAAIAATGGIVTATITAVTNLTKESRSFQRDLINRLLDREEKILSPLVGFAENVQAGQKVIGDGVADLLVAQKIEDGTRRREGGN